MNPATRHSTKRVRCSATRRATSRLPNSARGRGTQLRVSVCTSFVQESTTAPKLTLGPVVFRGIRAINWQRVSSNPLYGRTYCVLRSLWTEFPAQTVRVHSLQESAHAVLVSIHEFGHHPGGRPLQHCPGVAPAAPACGGPPRKASISQLVLVQPKSCPLRLGALGPRSSRLGLFHLEGSPPQTQGLVHAKAADLLAGRRHCSHDSLVDSRRAAPGP